MRLHRRKLAIAISLLLLIIVTCLLRPSGPPEPSYNGKTVSQWLEYYATPLPEGPGWLNSETRRNQTRDAFLHIGTNAIPVLLKKLNTHDSALKKFILAHSSAESAARIGIREETYYRYRDFSENESRRAHDGFAILGPAAERAVPGLINVVREPKNSLADQAALASLGFIGRAARPALPQLVNTLADPRTDPKLQVYIVDVIFKIAFDSTTGKFRPDCVPLLVPALTDVLKNPNVEVPTALVVIRLLSDIGPDAAPAVPAIKPFVNSTNANISSAATHALQRIDPTNPAIK